MKNTLLIFIILLNITIPCSATDTKSDFVILKKMGIRFDEKDGTRTEAEIEGLYEKRARQLTLHPYLGNITAALFGLTFMSAQKARMNLGKPNYLKSLKMHRNIAYVAAASYYATAYQSLTAPKPVDFPDEIERTWHKRMAYIHFPIMVLAPIIGTIAYRQRKKDGYVSGIGKLQKPLMYLGTVSFYAAFSIMTF